jgi:hypothetical protein
MIPAVSHPNVPVGATISQGDGFHEPGLSARGELQFSRALGRAVRQSLLRDPHISWYSRIHAIGTGPLIQPCRGPVLRRLCNRGGMRLFPVEYCRQHHGCGNGSCPPRGSGGASPDSQRGHCRHTNDDYRLRGHLLVRPPGSRTVRDLCREGPASSLLSAKVWLCV